MKKTITFVVGINSSPEKVWSVLTKLVPGEELVSDVKDQVGMKTERNYRSWRGAPLVEIKTITDWDPKKIYGYNSVSEEAIFDTVFYVRKSGDETKLIQIREAQGSEPSIVEQEFQVKRQMAKLKEDSEGKQKLGILLVTSPYSFQGSDTALRIANSALDKGYDVFIELTIDGATNIISSMKPFSPRPDYPLGKEGRNLSKQFEELRKKGAMISICNIHANHHGVNPKNKIPNIELGGLAPFSIWLKNCDKVLSFSI